MNDRACSVTVHCGYSFMFWFHAARTDVSGAEMTEAAPQICSFGGHEAIKPHH
ncbi:MAG: hypothetical protein H0W34_02240 [Pyrinomonadaceae bacterium]|nr:hypothetical protein [Pyrinomonadaceae bacterium]